MAGTGHWARLEYEDKDLLVEIKVQCFNEPVLESDSAEIGDDGISWTSSASWTSMAGGTGWRLWRGAGGSEVTWPIYGGRH